MAARITHTPAACIAIALLCLGAAGCPPKNEPPGPSPRDIWGLQRASLTDIDTARGDEAIATVNGLSIGRRQLADMLVNMYGLDLLDIEIRLQLAKSAAAQKGLTVTDADVSAELERNLKLLANANKDSAAKVEPFDRASAEVILNELLKQKGVGRDQFMLKVEMDAYLRKIAEQSVTVDEALLASARERATGERVRVRHIQLNSLRAAQMIREKLDRGESFEELARTQSVNPITAAGGGLLPPFSQAERTIPSAIRDAAFALSPGGVSNIIQVGPQYQILMLVERLPAEGGGDDSVDALRDRLKDRMVQEAMDREAARLFDTAKIVIHDPALRKQFQQRYRKGASVGP